MNTKHDLPLFNKGTIIFLQQMLNSMKFGPRVDQTFGLLCPCATTACFTLVHLFKKDLVTLGRNWPMGQIWTKVQLFGPDHGLSFLFGLNWKVWKSVLDKNMKTQDP